METFTTNALDSSLSIVSVVDTDGDRHVFEFTKILGIKDGNLYLETTIEKENTGDLLDFIGSNIKVTPFTSTITSCPLRDVAEVHTTTGVDDDYDSELTVSLEMSA